MSRSATSTSTRRRSSLATDPGRFDVIVTDNLFGDIITDIAAAIAGGIGLAASGNINQQATNRGMFRAGPRLGPDIAGQGKADPTATILSVAMLAHLGYAEASARWSGRSRPTSPNEAALRAALQVGDAAIAARPLSRRPGRPDHHPTSNAGRPPHAGGPGAVAGTKYRGR